MLQSPTPSHNHQVALTLAAKGVRVFPCRWEDGPPDADGNPKWRAKSPMPRVRWKDGATTDIDIINAWWTTSPLALVGMPLAPLNIAVLDPDQHPGGPDGVAAYDRLAERHPSLKSGPYVQTPQGRHHIFQQPNPPLGNAQGSLPPGINVRGVGGYVIAPGSELPDGRSWVLIGDGTEPQQLPLAVIDMIQGVSKETTGDFVSYVDELTYPSSPRHAAYLRKACENAVEKIATAKVGNRNNTLNVQAVKLGHFVGADLLVEHEVVAMLADAAISAGLDESEIGPTIQSGMAKGKSEPNDPLDVANEFWDGDIKGESIPKPTRRIYRASEMWSIPKPEYLIDGLIPERGVGLMIGDTRSFKSFIALSMGLAISQGRSDWEQHTLKTPPEAAVLYIAGEGGIEGAAQRMRAWAQDHGYSEKTLNDRFRVLTFPINLSDEKATTELIKLIQAEISEPLALIIIDTLNTSAPGAEENSTREMGALYTTCRSIGHTFHTTVMGIHHTNKQGKARGSNVLQQNADFLLFLKRATASTTMNVEMLIQKVKDGPDDYVEYYHLNLIALQDGSTSLVPHKIGAIDAQKVETTARGRPTSKSEAILDVLKASKSIKGESRSEICAYLNATTVKEKHNISQLLGKLLERGQVTRKGSMWSIVDGNDFLG